MKQKPPERQYSPARGPVRRRMFQFVPIVVVAAVFAGCGNFYNAEIQGFVVDGNSDSGINDATVRLYLDEPETADDESFFARTSTSTSNNQNGYFRNAVVWNAWFSSYGPVGDSGTVYLGITHPDFADAVVEVPGILSDTVNTVETIVLDRISFAVPRISGRVVDVNGDGVNGVRVVLDLLSTDDDTEDLVTVTGDEPEGDGYYVFEEVEWRDDENAGNETDDEEITISVDDDEWESSSNVTATVTSGQEHSLSTEILVSRQPRTEFDTTLTGSVVRVIGDTESPIAGVSVRVTLTGSGRLVSAQTAANGQYSARIEWTDTVPRDFDGDGSAAGGGDTSIPEGEDGLVVDIAYDIDRNGVYGEAPNTEGENELSISGFELWSWIDPNYAPDWDATP